MPHEDDDCAIRRASHALEEIAKNSGRIAGALEKLLGPDADPAKWRLRDSAR